MKILIVEANEALRRALRSLVADLVDEVYERSTSAEALAAYAQHQPDWVLLGLHLRELDGLETARQLTAVWPEARVALLADDDEQDWRAAAVRAGARVSVAKRDLIEVRRIVTGGSNAT